MAAVSAGMVLARLVVLIMAYHSFKSAAMRNIALREQRYTPCRLRGWQKIDHNFAGARSIGIGNGTTRLGVSRVVGCGTVS